MGSPSRSSTRLVFLGTGGSVATPQRHTSGIYLPDHGILLDSGTNVFPLRDLHQGGPLHVLMSHYHADHSIGLYFLSAGLFHGLEQPEITAYGPEWEDRFLATAGDGAPLFPIPIPFPLKRAPERFRLGEVEVETCPVLHTAPVLAYRLRFPSGETLAYVTDAKATGGYQEFIRGVDVLIHECTFCAAQRELAELTGHTDSASLGRLARQA